MDNFTEDQIKEYGKLRAVKDMVEHPIGQAALKHANTRKTLRSLCKVRDEPIPPALEAASKDDQK